MTFRRLKGHSERKEEEITLLDRIQASTARTSILQTRLINTLDTIDLLQRRHSEELASFTADRDRIKNQLQRYTDVVKSAESERDDMRDAVIKLIEKVEISNDYSKWPHSRIFLSSTADIPVTKRDASRLPDEEEQLLCASSMIGFLRKERDRERRAHIQTRELANARIVTLEAMLSRRDAELEACVASVDHRLSLQDSLLRPTSSVKDPLVFYREPMPREEVISIFDMTTARNNMLEMETNMLSRRLEDARLRRQADLNPPQGNADSLEEPSGSCQAKPDNSQDSGFKPLDPELLLGLKKGVDDLGSKIDAFSEERSVLTELIAHTSERNAAELNAEQLRHQLCPVELECERLRQTERLLRDQLDDARANARERETELMVEIDRLRLALQVRTPPLIEPQYGISISSHQTPPHCDHPTNRLDSNEEVSMELATPLIPTAALPVRNALSSPLPLMSDNHSHHSQNGQRESPRRTQDYDTLHETDDQVDIYVDHPSIPLPPSPEGLASWEENPSVPFLSQSIVAAFPLPPVDQQRQLRFGIPQGDFRQD